MKTLYIIIFFILLSVLACEEESVYYENENIYCWDCYFYYAPTPNNVIWHWIDIICGETIRGAMAYEREHAFPNQYVVCEIHVPVIKDQDSVYCWECQHTVITEYGIQTGQMSFYLDSDTIHYQDDVCGYTEDMMQSYLRSMSKDDTLEHSTITREVNCKQL